MNTFLHGFPPNKMQSPIAYDRSFWIALLVLILNWTQSSFECLRADNPSLSQAIDQVVAATYVGPEIPLASDEEFQRRVYLDLVGRSPTATETTNFLAQAASVPEGSLAAREQLIDDLLARDEFPFYYSKVLEVMFTERREVISTVEFRIFLRKWLEENRPLNELCTEVLAGDGTGGEMRAAGSFMINRNAEPNLVARDVSRIFFGRDVRCAQCHDHPLITDYEQAEYFGVLSFVNRTYLFTDEKRGNLPYLGEKGEGALEFASVFRPQDGKSMAEPILPMSIAMDAEPDFVDSADAYLVAPEKTQRAIPRYSRRQQLAVLATHPENEAFNRNMANRLWANMLGQGIVHPVDMHHSDNPPTSSALLRLLADHLVSSNYNLREILRQIARSKTYQRSSRVPNLDSWIEPGDLLDTLESELTKAQASALQLQPQREQFASEMAAATHRLAKAQADVAQLQQKIDSAKTQLLQMVEQAENLSKVLIEYRAKKDKQQEQINSLQTALQEADKILKATPDDTELAATRALLDSRLTAANQAQASLNGQIEEQQEQSEDTKVRIDDQRGRVHALVNRRLALGEFVVEARGVQRLLRKQIQAVDDKLSDCQQQEARIQILRNWLTQHEATRLANASGNVADVKSQELKLEIAEAELQEMWRRSYGLSRIRALSPEQMTGAIYYALEMYRPIEEKTQADWASIHQANPEMRDDLKKRQQLIAAAISSNIWDTVEDLIVPRFSFAPGSPQDGFFATVDQALTMQNDATYQSWLKSAPGNLVDRLMKTENPDWLAEQLYLTILCRMPDGEERKMVGEMLNCDADKRPAVVQELVWGLLASAEFRFLL